MLKFKSLCILVAVAGFGSLAHAQQRPYIGFAYPAGGKQGTTFEVKLGGQGLDSPSEVLVSGSGVTGKVVEYQRALNPQEITLLNEQLRELKQSAKGPAADMMSAEPMMAGNEMMQDAGATGGVRKKAGKGGANAELTAKIQQRLAHYVNRPASVALANIAYVKVTISPDAKPGQRELRLRTFKGISNPLYFHVGQLPEYTREPMLTAPLQVLGKEQLALRKRPAEQVEQDIVLPALNGQIASGEINRYKFTARKGQRLVISTLARQLVPFIADAVPGWFQPVLVLKDANGKEVAYDDDYEFRPDPVIFCTVPADGEYFLEIFDAIYRGREDFVYRITAGETPFLTSIFPLGGPADAPVNIQMGGWNLETNNPTPILEQGQPGFCRVYAATDGIISNPRPFMQDTLPDALEKEPNDSIAKAQAVKLPVIINGHMGHKDDWDVFKFIGKSNQVIVAEVWARRLGSPVDSVLKLTDATGKLIAFNDDYENPFAGANTHDADSYIRATLPADGAYYVHLGETAQSWGDDYAYRLRLSPPQPDFALRIVPSSLAIKSRNSASVEIHLVRKDGFEGAINVALKDPPPGFSARPISLTATQTVARIGIKTTLASTEQPVDLSIVGTAKVNGRQIAREAVPAEDRMQAFLWRHLVPASNFKVLVFDPSEEPPPNRVYPEMSAAAKVALVSTNAPEVKFSKQQVASRLRQLRILFQDSLLSDAFYLEKVAECDTVKNQ